MEVNDKDGKQLSLDGILTTAVQIRGVKVDRSEFLSDLFSEEDVSIDDIIELGPVQAGVSKETLAQMANKLIIKRTSQSSVASFVVGIPGGLAMAATIPADVLQFFGMALRLAQELSYLYGADDLWKNGQVDDEKVKKQLMLYCGAMFGVSGAVSGVRVLSTQVAKTTLKKLPQKALTKTFWYPMVKQIGKAVGVKVTKTSVAQGISKAVPFVGGIISGGLNFASMLPMANRLQSALDSANFGYTEEELENDIEIIESIDLGDGEGEKHEGAFRSKMTEGGKKIAKGISGLVSKRRDSKHSDSNDVLETINKLSEMKESGIITQEEFEGKKAELLAKL